MLQRLLKPTERLPSRGLDIRHWTSFGQPMGRETGPSLDRHSRPHPQNDLRRSEGRCRRSENPK
jgi:hypothetical protein